MFTFLKRGERVPGRIGLVTTEEGAAVAEIAPAMPSGKPRLRYCRHEPGSADAVLAELVKPLSSRRAPAVSVLPSSAYHLHLVEAPDVPPDELRAAVRWRIKDLIDFHVDDAVIDVFEMPAQARGGPNRMLYAVAAKAETVGRQVEDLERFGLRLEVVDIPELSLRNLGALLEDGSRGLALLYLARSTGTLLLIRQGVLYLARRIETGTVNLEQAGAMRSSLVAGLALEVRRSLDYFESHYEQNPLQILYAAGLESGDRDALAQELGASVSDVDLASVLETDLELDDETRRLCLPAIGAALRKDPVAL